MATSGFPPGSTLWDVNGVPVVMDAGGKCLAYDQSEVTPAQVYTSGKLLTDDDFIELASRPRGRSPNSLFAPGVRFWEINGIPIVQSQLGFATALDGSFCSPVMLHDFGAPLSEREFLDLLKARLTVT